MTVCPQLSFDAIYAHSVAPGECKLSSNILNEHNWDIKTFPYVCMQMVKMVYMKRKLLSYRLKIIVSTLVEQESSFSQ